MADEDRKPVWNAETMGPLPPGRDGVYDVAPPLPEPRAIPRRGGIDEGLFMDSPGQS